MKIGLKASFTGEQIGNVLGKAFILTLMQEVTALIKRA